MVNFSSFQKHLEDQLNRDEVNRNNQRISIRKDFESSIKDFESNIIGVEERLDSNIQRLDSNMKAMQNRLISSMESNIESNTKEMGKWFRLFESKVDTMIIKSFFVATISAIGTSSALLYITGQYPK